MNPLLCKFNKKLLDTIFRGCFEKLEIGNPSYEKIEEDSFSPKQTAKGGMNTVTYVFCLSLHPLCGHALFGGTWDPKKSSMTEFGFPKISNYRFFSSSNSDEVEEICFTNFRDFCLLTWNLSVFITIAPYFLLLHSNLNKLCHTKTNKYEVLLDA